MKKTSWSFKKLSKESRPWRFSAFRCKRLHLHTTIMDNVVFKIVSVVEGVILVSTVCVFYVCCGCHFWILCISAKMTFNFIYSFIFTLGCPSIIHWVFFLKNNNIIIHWVYDLSQCSRVITFFFCHYYNLVISYIQRFYHLLIIEYSPWISGGVMFPLYLNKKNLGDQLFVY